MTSLERMEARFAAYHDGGVRALDEQDAAIDATFGPKLTVEEAQALLAAADQAIGLAGVRRVLVTAAVKLELWVNAQ